MPNLKKENEGPPAKPVNPTGQGSAASLDQNLAFRLADIQGEVSSVRTTVDLSREEIKEHGRKLEAYNLQLIALQGNVKEWKMAIKVIGAIGAVLGFLIKMGIDYFHRPAQ